MKQLYKFILATSLLLPNSVVLGQTVRSPKVEFHPSDSMSSTLSRVTNFNSSVSLSDTILSIVADSLRTDGTATIFTVYVTDANGGITLMHYDNLGQLLWSRDPEEFTTHYGYDNLGRLEYRDHPDAGYTSYRYDPAGNLLEEINPLGQIIYDYTYYRPVHKRYNYMTGNDVTYTYGTSGTETGRPIRVVDGSGSYECHYDALGNVIDETRTIALPQHDEVYQFKMLYHYDSWGRMLSMVYPDKEEITYTYQWGGDLYAMHGHKSSDSRTYIKGILYNAYGQKVDVDYGNGTSAQYTYDSLHRLVNLKSRDHSGTLMQDIDYTFDNASNVTKIVNNAGVVNTLGGDYKNNYKYDALHRLVGSNGGGIIGNYDTYLRYSPSGRLIGKFRNNHSVTLSDTVGMYYGYCNDYQPHAVKCMFDHKNEMLYDMRWDKAGNLGQVSIAKLGEMFEKGRFLFWTEDSRMHAAVDDRYFSYYVYDHSGGSCASREQSQACLSYAEMEQRRRSQRRLKLTGDSKLLDVNADIMATYTFLDNPTLYPSAYMVLTNKGYTKHYYAGTDLCASREQSQACLSYAETKQSVRSNRVAARLGGGGLNALQPVVAIDDELQRKADILFRQSLDHVNHRVLGENDLDCIMHNEFARDEFGKRIDGIPYQVRSDVKVDNWQFKNMVNSMLYDRNQGHEKEVYFYHSDHLGSASWITNSAGDAIQHLQYLPYGEPYINQRAAGTTYSERFRFTGKERDEETGYGYFGARYMDHELMTMWLSVDPMADKYPSISPYAYCAWNPVKLVDPDGRDFDPTMEEYANKVIGFCDNKIKSLSEKESLTDEEKDCLSEFQSTKEEIEKMRNDHSTYYCVQSGSFGEKERKTKGVTQYFGYGDITRKGKQQHWIMVSLNVDCGLFTEDGGINRKGLQSLVHELKHCYQFYNNETLYILPANGEDFKVYNTKDLEKSAFNRAAAFGSLDRFDPDKYPALFKGPMDDFIQENPGCKVIKHK